MNDRFQKLLIRAYLHYSSLFSLHYPRLKSPLLLRDRKLQKALRKEKQEEKERAKDEALPINPTLPSTARPYSLFYFHKEETRARERT